MRPIVLKMFEMAEKFSANSPKGQDWLHDLRADADAGLNAWMNTLTGYVRGLWAAGVIGIEELDDFDKLRVEAGY